MRFEKLIEVENERIDAKRAAIQAGLDALMEYQAEYDPNYNDDSIVALRVTLREALKKQAPQARGMKGSENGQRD